MTQLLTQKNLKAREIITKHEAILNQMEMMLTRLLLNSDITTSRKTVPKIVCDAIVTHAASLEDKLRNDSQLREILKIEQDDIQLLNRTVMDLIGEIAPEYLFHEPEWSAIRDVVITYFFIVYLKSMAG